MRLNTSSIPSLAIGLLVCATSATTHAQGVTEHFERRIRPLLIKHCISCHGPKKQESGLRLDSRAAILQGGDRGPAVEGKQKNVDRNLLMQAVLQRGDLKMPPKRKLNVQEVADLRRWLAAGMVWPSSRKTKTTGTSPDKHWAFQPIRRPTVPSIAEQRARNPIDAFVVRRLQQARPPLQLARAANRYELIRRLTFDLWGLPPTPAAVRDFIADKKPQAYERLVERLLASPRYGERWGRLWLDVARYADNRGYVFFINPNFPWSYTYRDYVISAWNRDLPYDRFIMEQLAADLLDLGSDPSPLAGMGLLTVGAQFMNNVHDVIDDRIDVISRGLMALTVSCARCHDHKFDPIPQADYYSLYGVLRSSEEPVIPPALLQSTPRTKVYRDFVAGLKQRSKTLDSYIKQRFGVLVQGARRRVSEYLMAVYRQQDQPDQDDFMLLVNTNDVNPTMIIRWRHYLRTMKQHDPVWGPWQAMRRLPVESFAAAAAQVTRRLIKSGRLNALVRRTVLGSPPRTLQQLADRYGQLFLTIDKQWERARAQDKQRKRFANADQEQVRQHIYGRKAPPTIPVKVGWGLLTIFPDRATQGEFRKRFKALEKWIESAPGAPPRAMSLAEKTRPFEPRIFLRGNAHRKGPAVPRRFLQLLSGKDRAPFRQGSGRLEMARAIASKKNPLTARVIVNRIWQHHFGQGLVTTTSDFGLRSSPPSHPDLLDYLATHLIDHDWSLKSLQRLILTSATFRQSSDFKEKSFDQDPGNRLLWRFNRRRLDFESMRDTILLVSGQLDLRIGGKPLELHAGGRLVPRRSIYGFVNRMDVSPLMTTFDFPNPVATSPGRVSTTVAPQALYFMNNKMIHQVTGNLAQRLGKGTVTEQIRRLYWTLYSRPATGDELKLAERYLGRQPKLARWQKLIQAFLMTNEFVYVD